MYTLMLQVVELVCSALSVEIGEASREMHPDDFKDWVPAFLDDMNITVVVIGCVREFQGAVPGTEPGTVYFLSYVDNPYNREFVIPQALRG